MLGWTLVQAGPVICSRSNSATTDLECLIQLCTQVTLAQGFTPLIFLDRVQIEFIFFSTLHPDKSDKKNLWVLIDLLDSSV